MINNVVLVSCIQQSDAVIYINCESCSVMSDSLPPHGLYNPWSSPGQNTGVGSPSLLQGIFPTQGSNPGLLHCRQILYYLSHEGSPSYISYMNVKLLSCVWLFAIPFAYHARLSMEFSGKSARVGCHFLLQGIFLIQGLNPGLPPNRHMPYCLSQQESPSYISYIYTCIYSFQIIFPFRLLCNIEQVW